MSRPDGRCGTPTQKDWALYSSPKDAYTYHKFVEQLISPAGEVESCTCLITDTVFISDDGKPQLFVKTDRDGKVATVNKLSVQDIRTRIPDVVKQRKEEQRHVLSVLAQQLEQGNTEGQQDSVGGAGVDDGTVTGGGKSPGAG